MKYAIKLPIDIDASDWLYLTNPDEDGNPVVVTFDTKEMAESVNFGVWSNYGRVVEYKEPKAKTGNIFIDASNLVDDMSNEEIEELRAKKQAIYEELYELVKMEMFKASSKLEDIEYEGIEVQCKTHPDAPHGFDRNSSLSLGRYVCECEHWFPDWEQEELEVEGWNIEKPQELKELLEHMIQRINLLEDGNNHSREITDEEYELFEKLKKIWLHSVPDKSGHYFICGDAGDRDESGLPEKIMVCPAYGSDGFAIYTKTTDYSAPGY